MLQDLKTGFDQDTVDAGQRNHIADCAKSDKIEILLEVRRLPSLPDPLFSQMTAKPHDKIKRHTDPGKVLIGKCTTVLVRIQNGVSFRQLFRRLMMIGNNN